MFDFIAGRKPATVAGPGDNISVDPPRTNAPHQRAAVSAHAIDVHRPIEHSDDLPDFTKKLYDEIALIPSLKHRICPVELPPKSHGRKQFAIILLAEETKTQITEELTKQVKVLGYEAASPLFYVASKQVMVELARDTILNKMKAQKVNAGVKSHDSALYAMFESVAVFAIENDASDIHFEVNRGAPTSHIRFRVDGRMTSPRQFEWKTLELLDMIAYLYNVHSKSGSENTYNENKPQQCQIKLLIKNRRLLFRWASNQTADGTKVVMRMLFQDTAQSIRSLIELGYLPGQVNIWMRAIARLGGGTLVSGVVGSGKSTTMQTVMSMLPAWMSKNTVEDPVEYIIPGTTQFSVSRTLGDRDKDNDPFLAVKRQLKRMDPDVVMIGEIRDNESAGLFRDIAESGHRAFATVHAPSAIDMITLRLVSSELGIPRDVIATPNFLNLLVYQALVPKLCTKCKLPADQVYPPEYVEQIKRLFGFDTTHMCGKNATGCPDCMREHLPELSGSKGRLVVAEMIEPTPKMLMLFREAQNIELKKYIQSQRTAKFDEPDSTGKSALEVAIYHVARGVIDPKEVELKFGSFDQYEQERIELSREG